MDQFCVFFPTAPNLTGKIKDFFFTELMINGKFEARKNSNNGGRT